ncbi:MULTISPECIES: hypothetical protein [Erythrobacteraceae]|jgi:hypothetical protein|nr:MULTISPECIES: hypothetical protein [Erythrobacteraceae]|tara:strand:- start:683 stop:817 length:135 start_codon:yes stop_codon:yes gene_type:complete
MRVFHVIFRIIERNHHIEQDVFVAACLTVFADIPVSDGPDRSDQ